MYRDDDTNSVFYLIRNIDPCLLEVNYYRRYISWGRNPHAHEHLQFLYVTSGEVSLVINDRTYELHRGDLSLIPPHVIHEIYTNTEYEQVGANILLTDETGMMGVCGLLKQHVTNPIILRDSDLLNHAETIKKMLSNATVLNETKAAYRVGRMLLHVLDTIKTNEKEDIAEQLIDYFNEHMGEKILVQDAANAFHMSVSHLERIAHTHFNMGLIALYNRLRVDYACNLLINSSLSISDIAFRVGFAETSAFSAFFKRYEGRSPKVYREQRRYE